MSDSFEIKAIGKIMVPGLHKVLKDQKPEDRFYFRQLKGDETPLMPVPEDEIDDIYYKTGYSQQCSVCNSPYRKVVEHVYLANGDDIQSVRHYFMKYYGARITHHTVQQHMDKHCDLRELRSSGLRNLAKANDEIDFWSPRPTELAMRAVLKQIDDVQGLRTAGNADLTLKKAMAMQRLTDQLLKVREAHKDSMDNDMDAMTILGEIAQEIDDPILRQKILLKIRTMRERIRG